MPVRRKRKEVESESEEDSSEVSSDESSDEDTESEEDNVPPPSKRKKKAAPASKGRRGKKKKKDPNAPKKAMSAYMLYSNDVRAQIMKENPGLKFGQITKEIAGNFRDLSEKERKKWDKKARQDKERYEREMADYSAPEESSDSDSYTGKKKRRKKDPNAPKKALSSYMYFMNKNRARIKEAHPDASFGDVAKLVAAEFRQLTPEGKEKYIEMAAKDKIRYAKEMEGYTPPKGLKGKKGKDPNKPKRAMTSFMCFSNAMRATVKEEMPDLTFGATGKELGKRFRELTAKEKSKYIKIADKDKERYRVAMDAYNRKQAGYGSDEASEEGSADQSGSGSGSDDSGDKSGSDDDSGEESE